MRTRDSKGKSTMHLPSTAASATWAPPRTNNKGNQGVVKPHRFVLHTPPDYLHAVQAFVPPVVPNIHRTPASSLIEVRIDVEGGICRTVQQRLLDGGHPCGTDSPPTKVGVVRHLVEGGGGVNTAHASW
jgi:hypothetical protein